MGKISWLENLLLALRFHLRCCQHENCWKRNAVPCFLEMQYTGESNKPDYYYCGTHCHQEGFCWSCGQFWAGIENFDFSRSGLCMNCEDAGDYDDPADPYAYSEEIEWDDFYGDEFRS